MSSPYKGAGRGIAMLNLLRTLSPSIVPFMADIWEKEIPLLVQYLEGEHPLTPIFPLGNQLHNCKVGAEAQGGFVHAGLWVD